MTTGQGTARYAVVSEGTQPAGSAEAMLPTTTGRLTLVTSDPAVFANRYRVAVARLVSGPFAATGHASTISRIELGLTGDPAAAGDSVRLVARRALGGLRRSGRVPPRAPRDGVVDRAPLVLAAAWLVFENLVVLLPASL